MLMPYFPIVFSFVLFLSIESFILHEDPKIHYRGLKEIIGQGGYSVV